MSDSKKYLIDPHDLAEWLTECETKKSSIEIATELYQTRGKDFCIAIVLHLIMYISGNMKLPFKKPD